MESKLQGFIASLGYEFTIDLNQPPDKWVYVTTEKFKGGWIYGEIRQAGKVSITLTVFDFRKQEHHTQRFDSEPLSPDEEKNVARLREMQQNLAESEKQKAWEECKAYCQEEWARHDFTKQHPYANKKGIALPDAVFKHRLNPVSGTFELLCPLTDTSGGLWGYQIIGSDGQKRFDLGQRTQGVFTAFGNLSGALRVYLSEGVATAASVYEALGGKYPVLACISAGNLEHVARAVRAVLPKSPIVIAADNDQWKPKNGNVGLQKAEAAAKAVDGCVFIWPEFDLNSKSVTDSQPTDFNDLHGLLGLGAVAERLTEAKPKRPEHVWAVGYRGDTSYLTCLRSPRLHEVREGSASEFLRLAQKEYWARTYPTCVTHTKAGPRVDWEAVKSKVFHACQTKGMFIAEKRKGLGMYMDGKKPVIHLGDRLFVDGAEIELQDFEGENFYDLKARQELPERVTEFKPKEFVDKLHKFMSGYVFEHKLSPEFFIGWIYCAFAAGALEWRPHIMVSAKVGSGKSTFIDQLLTPLLKYVRPVGAADGTEAGIRQSLGNDAMPVLYDEFDTNKKKPKTLEAFLSLARAASSGGTIFKGTPGGKALQFEARFCAYMTGVNTPDVTEADQTRITQLRLISNNKSEKWAVLESRLAELTGDEAARGVYWQVFDTLVAYQETYKRLHNAFSHVSERVGQQYGALLAGFWHMGRADAMSKETAEEFVRRFKHASEEAGEEIETGDRGSLDCREWLMQLVIKADRGVERSLGSILDEVASSADVGAYGEPLRTVGIKIVAERRMFVAGNSKILKKHYEGTDWPNYAQSLGRLDGACKAKRRVGESKYDAQSRGVDLSF